MEHYFIDKEHKESDYFEFSEVIDNYHYVFKSCDDIFSKDNVDYGTKVLIEIIIKKENLQGDCLDVGCGYGPIGIVLSNHFKETTFDMIDINNTAVSLSKQNVIKNHIKNVNDVFYSNAYENVKKVYDNIITNPPIKAGKENLFNILIGAFDFLKEGGKLYFVIKKKHGEASVKKKLESIYSSVEIIKREKGYYILKCIK